MNKRDKLVAERLAWAEAIMGAEEQFPEWVEEGGSILAELRAAAHGEIDPRSVEEARARRWQRYGWNIEAGAKEHGLPVVNEWLPANRRAAMRVATRMDR